MRRIHLFEFEDQPWFPQVIRNGITDYLHFIVHKTSFYKKSIPIYKEQLDIAREKIIVDLCSGASGGIMYLYKELHKIGIHTQIILTDKYPNIEAFKKIHKESKGQILFRQDSVDARDIPNDLIGLRSQLVSFHHFKPKDARLILENAYKSKSPIIIFEITEKTLSNVLMCLLAPVLTMLCVPFIKPFKLSRLFFTYIIPAIPFFTMWDGLVSILRTYSIEEMQELVAGIGTNDYTWQIGKLNIKGSFSALYLIGNPNDKNNLPN